MSKLLNLKNLIFTLKILFAFLLVFDLLFVNRGFISTSFSKIKNESGLFKSEKVNSDSNPVQTATVVPTVPLNPIPTPISNPIVNTNNWWKYPDTISEIPINSINIDTKVNKSHKLPLNYSPSDLIVLKNEDGIRTVGSVSIRKIVVQDLTKLVKAAKEDGVDLSIVSGYRSYDTQISTYKYWLGLNGNNADVVDQFSARAGHSEHQLGTAIDFSTSEVGDALGSKFNTSKANKWLLENASKYGFVQSYPQGKESETGYKYEGWHYRYYGNKTQ